MSVVFSFASAGSIYRDNSTKQSQLRTSHARSLFGSFFTAPIYTFSCLAQSGRFSAAQLGMRNTNTPGRFYNVAKVFLAATLDYPPAVSVPPTSSVLNLFPRFLASSFSPSVFICVHLWL